MTYENFLKDIKKYERCFIEITGKIKATNKICKVQRFVWDDKEFCPLSEDSLVEVLNVEIIG